MATIRLSHFYVKFSSLYDGSVHLLMPYSPLYCKAKVTKKGLEPFVFSVSSGRCTDKPQTMHCSSSTINLSHFQSCCIFFLLTFLLELEKSASCRHDIPALFSLDCILYIGTQFILTLSADFFSL